MGRGVQAFNPHRLALLVLELQTDGIKRYMLLGNWLLFLSVMFWRFTHTLGRISEAFLLIAKWYSIV